jgi:8-oxo-dGTP pyrophosphatase MutT (NUDIX family)
MDEAASPGEKIGPWTRLTSRDIYDNPWIRVREDGILNPDGSPGIYGVVEFKNIAVGVVALDAAGRVLLVGQHRYTLDSYSWEIPEGGGAKGKDTPESTAARELREETGFTAGRWNYLGCIAVSNSVSDEVGHFFLARELTPGPTHPDASEELQVRMVDLEEAYRMAMEGVLNESLTITGLARARHFLSLEAQGRAPREYPREP